MNVHGRSYRAVWMDGGDVVVINQPLLPHRFALRRLKTHRETATAIRTMIIRGAGTIGATAGYGLAQAFAEAAATTRTPAAFQAYLRRAYDTLNRTRPTAADLKHALDRVLGVAQLAGEAVRAARAEAEAIADEYVDRMQAIARHGLKLIRNGTRVLTHCNAGWLALVDWGSAPAPIYLAHRRGRKVFVWVDETRPRCQGANLTSWELLQEGVPHRVIPDNAAGFYLRRGEVDLCLVGADRIAANGDTANKIGTYEKAVVAHANGVPFYVVAPSSTIDFRCRTGDDIPIEERDEDEVHYVHGRDDRGRVTRVRVTPCGARAANPAFDVTPARYITGIITERGIVRPGALRRLFR